MSDEAILDSYKQLCQSENCIAEIDSRPVYVSTEKHIQAHFFNCFIAFIVIRLLQYKTNRSMSPARMINALNSAKTTHLQDDCYRLLGHD